MLFGGISRDRISLWVTEWRDRSIKPRQLYVVWDKPVINPRGHETAPDLGLRILYEAQTFSFTSNVGWDLQLQALSIYKLQLCVSNVNRLDFLQTECAHFSLSAQTDSHGFCHTCMSQLRRKK